MLKDKFGFNFWPSFTDLMLSLVLVVLIILFVVSKMIAAGNENLDRARDSQEAIQSEIKRMIGSRYTIKVISDRNNKDTAKEIEESMADINIIDKLDRQTITFSDKLLFDSGKSDLKTAGLDVLNDVGPVIKNNLQFISEIQIQGHADIVNTDDFNLRLASERAMSVYKFIQNNVGIDPAEHLISITSFGKYKPIGREAGDEFNKFELSKANETDTLRAKNRRIEIVLFYKNELEKETK